MNLVKRLLTLEGLGRSLARGAPGTHKKDRRN